MRQEQLNQIRGHPAYSRIIVGRLLASGTSTLDTDGMTIGSAETALSASICASAINNATQQKHVQTPSTVLIYNIAPAAPSA